MKLRRARLSAAIAVVLVAVPAFGQGTVRGTNAIPQQRPFLRRDLSSRMLYAKILEYEDQRVYTQALADLLGRPHIGVRRRAAMAIGRIGDRAGVDVLMQQLKRDEEPSDLVRQDVVFALGEIEHARAVQALLDVLKNLATSTALRARVYEALGKIGANPVSAAALGPARLEQIAGVIAAGLPPTDKEARGDDLLVGSLGIVALLRLKQPSSVPVLVAQLSARTSALRAQAANAIARFRPDSAGPAAVPALVAMLTLADPIERANAARALAALKAADQTPRLIPLLADPDLRVRASVIRALGTLGDARAVAPLNAMAESLLAEYRRYIADQGPGVPPAHNLLMLVAEAQGLLKDPTSLPTLNAARLLDGHAGGNPETEIAAARFGPEVFFGTADAAGVPAEWHHVSNYAQGLGALGGERALRELLEILAGKRLGPLDPRAQIEVINALGQLKPPGLEGILIDQLSAKDFYVRATAAGLLAEQFAPAQSEATFAALEAALKAASSDVETDARLAILEAISKYKRQRALDLLSTALNDPDYLVKHRAAELLEASSQGSFIAKVGPAKTPVRPHGFYEDLEAAMRLPPPIAVITTEKGDIRMELLIRDAPLNVENFIELARKNYFNGIVFHRVVPNFVVQGGDPRGDGNGGPGYQIRCEINKVPYDRGAVGMALSGKDTGGSQFFFTHSPQPHLDGGYTVFGRVTDGMDVVDQLARGDRILSVTILDRPPQ
ncbi:MAG TPA: peptidylprolyl isomerase [Blastocatellia bacterium]|nr:peptidylprolyl isomerase [Blastocatellia bacterium]